MREKAELKFENGFTVNLVEVNVKDVPGMKAVKVSNADNGEVLCMIAEPMPDFDDENFDINAYKEKVGQEIMLSEIDVKSSGCKNFEEWCEGCYEAMMSNLEPCYEEVMA